MMVAPAGAGATIGAAGAYRSLTHDHTKLGSGDLTDFPVLLDVTDATLKSISNGGHVNRTDGFDIFVTTTATGSTQIPFERESYDPATGRVRIHIKAPSLSHTTDGIYGYLRYGDTSVTTDQSNATGVWDTNFKRVYHLGDGSTLSGTDSTGNGNGTVTNATAGTGQIYGAGNFAATSNQYIENAAAAVTTFPLTLSAWVKLADTSLSVGEERVIAAVVNKGSLEEFWLGYFNDGGTICLRTVAQGGGNVRRVECANTLNTNWHLCAGVFTDASTHDVYQDGIILSGSVLGGSVTPSGLNTTYVGGLFYNTSNFYGQMKGLVDEVRISNIARSASWLLAEYNNGGSPGTFTTLGAETPI